ncbi:protein neprosin-like [Magnolia sinica]|uniref:protein neprosin-like n=1 Tax=Magnolia sinica TaxID=86752 RepID=UPI002658A066|nr:protein neprosin-like [Magnolia sinica]
MEKTRVRRSTFSLAVVIIVAFIDAAVGGSSSISRNKPAVKTIKSEDGDIIDCVDIFHQPAFDHPLLKNHTIQVCQFHSRLAGPTSTAKRETLAHVMWPSYYPKSKVKKVSSEPLQQLWQKSGSCPQGTIPIRRTQKNNSITAVHDQSQITVVREIYSDHYGDNKTRLYIYWTADGGVKTGCYDLLCSGFIQVNPRFVLGGSLYPVSTYDGPQYTLTVKIYMDRPTQNWWLFIQDLPVGYWPISLFTNLKFATKVQWMGQVANAQMTTVHIITPMGSGHSPLSSLVDLGRAAFFKNIMYVDENGASVAPGFSANFVSTNPNCYHAQGYDGSDIPGHGFYLFYGGPQGVSSKCN